MRAKRWKDWGFDVVVGIAKKEANRSERNDHRRRNLPLPKFTPEVDQFEEFSRERLEVWVRCSEMFSLMEFCWLGVRRDRKGKAKIS